VRDEPKRPNPVDCLANRLRFGIASAYEPTPDHPKPSTMRTRTVGRGGERSTEEERTEDQHALPTPPQSRKRDSSAFPTTRYIPRPNPRPSMNISPPVLFFVLGAIAALVKSDLRVPRQVTKLLSLYLLWAIGFTGGVKIAQSGLDRDALVAIVIGVALAAAMPLAIFALLRRRLGVHDAAAVAACYGSVSAVTFLTAASILDDLGIAYGGHMVAVMALMESPAIVVSILLLRKSQPQETAEPQSPRAGWGMILHEAFLNGPVLLLLGSLVIGLVTRERGFEAFKPLCKDLFNGVLVFFLLDLGLLAARRLRTFLSRGLALVGYGIVIPPVAAAIALALARAGGLPLGDAVLLAVLASSASYIAVPAAARIAIPKAEPSVYIGMALAVTFPFNVILGIPLYLWAARLAWGG